MRRRGHGEGSIYKRKDGRWEAQLRIERGGRRSLYGRSRRDAQQKLALAIRARQDGLLGASTRQSVSQYLEQWLNDVAQPSLRPSTFASYRLNVTRACRFFGQVRLTELRAHEIQALYAELMRASLAPRTIWQTHVVLHRAMKDAVFAGLIARNPLDGVSRPRASFNEIRTLSTTEVKRLIESTQGQRLGALWTLLTTTGLRLGEALGLTWSDIDLDYGRLSVRRALQRNRGEGLVMVEPKSARSRRLVALSLGTVRALREHALLQAAEREVAGASWPASGLVFTSKHGRALGDGYVSWRFHKALANAELPRIRIHDLRHTAATLLLEGGVHPKVVQEMLGHSTITLTLDTYSHVVPGIQAEAAARMQQLFVNAERDTGTAGP